MKTQTYDSSLYPETAKFMEWYNAEKAKGLLDVKFYVQGAEGTTVEAFLGEVNRALRAEVSTDPEFF